LLVLLIVLPETGKNMKKKKIKKGTLSMCSEDNIPRHIVSSLSKTYRW
jgi:hypothetical protein